MSHPSRLITGWLAGVALMLGLTGCAEKDPPPATAPTVVQTTEGLEDWLQFDDEDVPDCERADRKAQETPDCGFIAADGKYYEWTWVKKGFKTFPRGWRAGPEKAAVNAVVRTPAAAPKTTAARPPQPTLAPAKPARPASPVKTTSRKTPAARR